MRFFDVVRRSGRNLRQAKVRTLLTAIALAVGGFTLTLTLAASQGARDYAHRLVATNFDPSSLIVSKDKSLFSGGAAADNKPQPYSDSLVSVGGGAGGFYLKALSDKDIAKIKTLPGVDSVLVYYSGQAQYVSGPNGQKYTASFEAYDPHVTHQYEAGSVAPGGVLDGQVLLPQDYVSDLGFKSPQAAIGQTIDVALRQITGVAVTRHFTVAAVESTPSTLADSASSEQLLFSEADAQSAYEYINAGTVWADKHLTVSVHVHGGSSEQQLHRVKQEIEHAGYAAESVQDTEQFINQIINVLQIIILVFGAITLIASFFGVVNTQYISVLERTREIGLMKALGMSRGTVSRLFIVEATWIGFLGAVIGCAAAIALGVALNPWISQKLDFGSDRLLVFEPVQIAALVVFLMLITTLAGLLPARKAARLDPIEALRTE